jgi:hypothetical protein
VVNRFFSAIFVSLLISGCCGPEIKAPAVVSQELLTDLPVEENSETAEKNSIDLTEELTPGLTFAEKWQDFQRQLQYRPETELIYYAEGLLTRAPRSDLQKRMELSFFLQNAYIKKGQREKAGEYGTLFTELQKQLMSGAHFRQHNERKQTTAELVEKWRKSGEEEYFPQRDKDED